MKNQMKIGSKDRLIILAMWTIAMIILLLIFIDPLNFLDNTQKIILAVIVLIANIPVLLFQLLRIKKTYHKLEYTQLLHRT